MLSPSCSQLVVAYYLFTKLYVHKVLNVTYRQRGISWGQRFSSVVIRLTAMSCGAFRFWAFQCSQRYADHRTLTFDFITVHVYDVWY